MVPDNPKDTSNNPESVDKVNPVEDPDMMTRVNERIMRRKHEQYQREIEIIKNQINNGKNSQSIIMITAEPSSAITAGNTGTASIEFNADYTLLMMNSSVAGQKAKHTDFRMEISTNNSSNFSNKPFSARSYFNDGKGLDFIKEIGQPIYVRNGQSIDYTFYNDSLGSITPKIHFLALRGWQSVIGLRKFETNPDKQGFRRKAKPPLRGLDLLPYCYVVKPSSSISTGTACTEFTESFSGYYTFLKMRAAYQGLAENTDMEEFGVKMSVGDVPNQIDSKYCSSLVLTKGGDGFDFVKDKGIPMIVASKYEDRIKYTFKNETGSTITPSLEYMGYNDELELRDLKKLTDARLAG